MLLSSVDVDCTDLDHILDNCQFDPHCLTRETLAGEGKSSAQSQFVLDRSMPSLNWPSVLHGSFLVSVQDRLVSLLTQCVRASSFH
jgi:hypothetical protein